MVVRYLRQYSLALWAIPCANGIAPDAEPTEKQQDALFA